MAFHYSPKTTTGGLILYLDFANNRTYSDGDQITKDLISDYDATPQNNPTFSLSNNGGFILNGVDGYFEFTKPNPITGTSSFTLCAWLDTKTHSENGFAVFFGNAVTGESFYLGYVATANAGTSNTIGGGFYGLNFGTGVTDSTGPHYLSMTYDGSSNSLKIYVDGDLKINPTLLGTPNFQSSSIFLGKSNDVPYYYNGSIFSTKLYNRVLSSNEILQNFNTTKSRFGL